MLEGANRLVTPWISCSLFMEIEIHLYIAESIPDYSNLLLAKAFAVKQSHWLFQNMYFYSPQCPIEKETSKGMMVDEQLPSALGFHNSTESKTVTQWLK